MQDGIKWIIAHFDMEIRHIRFEVIKIAGSQSHINLSINFGTAHWQGRILERAILNIGINCKSWILLLQAIVSTFYKAVEFERAAGFYI